MAESLKNQNSYRNLIIIVSVLIPVLVAFLILIPQTGRLGDWDVSFLPHLHGVLNSLTAVCLVAAFWAIKNKNITLHRNFMMTAVFLSVVFLISYVIYHFQGVPTLYGDTDRNGSVSAVEKVAAGNIRYLYYFVLMTHIILSAIVVPFVLFALYYALSKQFDRHQEVVKWSFPIWLYVAISGVVVYLMIKPYY